MGIRPGVCGLLFKSGCCWEKERLRSRQLLYNCGSSQQRWEAVGLPRSSLDFRLEGVTSQLDLRHAGGCGRATVSVAGAFLSMDPLAGAIWYLLHEVSFQKEVRTSDLDFLSFQEGWSYLELCSFPQTASAVRRLTRGD